MHLQIFKSDDTQITRIAYTGNWANGITATESVELHFIISMITVAAYISREPVLFYLFLQLRSYFKYKSGTLFIASLSPTTSNLCNISLIIAIHHLKNSIFI